MGLKSLGSSPLWTACSSVPAIPRTSRGNWRRSSRDDPNHTTDLSPIFLYRIGYSNEAEKQQVAERPFTMLLERRGALSEGAEVFRFKDEGRHISGGAFADRASCKPSPQNANRNKPAERELRRLGNSVVLPNKSGSPENRWASALLHLPLRINTSRLHDWTSKQYCSLCLPVAL
jgi:hypothetical protein